MGAEMGDSGSEVWGYEEYLQQREAPETGQSPHGGSPSYTPPGGGQPAAGGGTTVSPDVLETRCPVRYHSDGSTTFNPNDCPDLGGPDMPSMGTEDYEPPDSEPDEPDAPEPEPEPEPIVVTVEDLQSLPIDPGGLNVQPGRGWVLVNKETIAYTGATEQYLRTHVLGTPVEVHVVPIDHTWDWGDGTVTTTEDPGAPYPEHSVFHTYTQAGDSRQITVTTRWIGEFQVAGSGPWLPVEGLATTTVTSEPFEVREADTYLTAPGG